MGKLKTLATCEPGEFLRQTNKIRKSVEKWITATNITEIRSRKPDLEVAPDNASPDVVAEILERNKQKIEKQVRENISAMLDSILDEHPDETLELFALCSFVEPEEVNSHSMHEYLEAFNALIADKAVIGFFTSLVSLVQMGTSVVSKA